MGTTGLPVFDTTVQETNLWLKAVERHLHQDDRHLAYLALRATLHALRDRLPPQNAVQFGAQLPVLLRGVFYEGWRMAATPGRERHVVDFVGHVRDGLPGEAGDDPHLATRAALAVIAERLDPGEVAKILRLLPAELRQLWPDAAQRI
jgi:uncharacterized protein (DUF2267 family)